MPLEGGSYGGQEVLEPERAANVDVGGARRVEREAERHERDARVPGIGPELVDEIASVLGVHDDRIGKLSLAGAAHRDEGGPNVRCRCDQVALVEERLDERLAQVPVMLEDQDSRPSRHEAQADAPPAFVPGSTAATAQTTSGKA